MAVKKSKEYWQDRHKQWGEDQDKADKKLNEKLEKQYRKMSKEVERDIAGYFAKYGKEDVIDFRKLLQDLTDSDRQMLFEDMESFAERFPEYERFLPIRESIYKLNRLQGLHQSINMKLLELGAFEQKAYEAHLIETYGRNYKALMLELGLGTSFVAVSDAVILNTVYRKWVNSQDFSDRIWRNKAKMLGYVQNELRDGFARGDSYRTLSNDMRNRFDVGAYEARRLVTTEANFIQNQAHRLAYTQNGVEEYELNAILDSKTSKICRSLDGERFRFDQAVVGTNFPPFHVFCRMTFIGVLDNFL